LRPRGRAPSDTGHLSGLLPSGLYRRPRNPTGSTAGRSWRVVG